MFSLIINSNKDRNLANVDHESILSSSFKFDGSADFTDIKRCKLANETSIQTLSYQAGP
jgi:hypothetical protein